jgi:hypothetical protein
MRSRANRSHRLGIPITAKPAPSRSVECGDAAPVCHSTARGISSSVAVVGGETPIKGLCIWTHGPYVKEYG